MKDKHPKEKKVKPEKIKMEKTPGRGRTAIAVIALVLALAGLGGGVYFGLSLFNQAESLSEKNSVLGGKVAALEEAAATEKNRESLVIQMEPHGLAVYMADSAYLYKPRFANVRFDNSPETADSVKQRVPVTVTLYNTSDQTITVKGAALYPWETVFEETAVQETLAAKQRAGFFGELALGQKEGFSVAPGESYAMEVDARLRGVYGHPALEAETQRFLSDRLSGPDDTPPEPADDVAVSGKGLMNGNVNFLFREALGFYCAQRYTRFTLNYTVETARGNTFTASCVVPF